MSEWRLIQDFPDYEVSDDGSVRNIAVGKGRRGANHVLKQTLDEHGYPRVSLRRDGKTFCRKVHRLVALAFLAPAPSPKHDAAHNDGKPANCHYLNLRWATRKENMADTLKHGTRVRGEKHGTAKLTEEQVIEIRALLDMDAFTKSSIAAQYGVSAGQITHIASGKHWAHIPKATA